MRSFCAVAATVDGIQAEPIRAGEKGGEEAVRVTSARGKDQRVSTNLVSPEEGDGILRSDHDPAQAGQKLANLLEGVTWKNQAMGSQRARRLPLDDV
jgi:hypothetical protein